MRKIKLWIVRMTSRAGGYWTGVFLEEPSVNQLEAAIWLEIEEFRSEGNDERCDEEDGELLCHQEEQMMVFSDLANHVPETFCALSCEQDLQVANVRIGSVHVEQSTVYTTEEELVCPDVEARMIGPDTGARMT